MGFKPGIYLQNNLRNALTYLNEEELNAFQKVHLLELLKLHKISVPKPQNSTFETSLKNRYLLKLICYNIYYKTSREGDSDTLNNRKFGYIRVSSKDQNEGRQLEAMKQANLSKTTFYRLVKKYEKILKKFESNYLRGIL